MVMAEMVASPFNFNDNNLETITNNVATDTNNLDNPTNSIYCKGCRKYYDPELFINPRRSTNYKRCSLCRQRDFARRHPQARLNIGPSNIDSK